MQNSELPDPGVKPTEKLRAAGRKLMDACKMCIIALLLGLLWIFHWFFFPSKKEIKEFNEKLQRDYPPNDKFGN